MHFCPQSIHRPQRLSVDRSYSQAEAILHDDFLGSQVQGASRIPAASVPLAAPSSSRFTFQQQLRYEASIQCYFYSFFKSLPEPPPLKGTLINPNKIAGMHETARDWVAHDPTAVTTWGPENE